MARAGTALAPGAGWEVAALCEMDGAELVRNGKSLLGMFQEHIAYAKTRADARARTLPVQAYAPNGFGVSALIGNVTQWTTDWFSTARQASVG